MDKKEFKSRNLNIGIKIMYKKQGQTLFFNKTIPEFLAKR